MPNTKTKNEDGSMSYRTIHGRKFTITKHPDADPNDVAGSIVAVALQTHEALADKVHSVTTDPTLSQVGRERALTDINVKSATQMAQFWSQLNELEKSIENRYQALLAIPELPASNLVIAFEDTEIRQWWSRAPADDKGSIIAKAATDPKCARVIVAILRSPIPPGSDAELKAIHETWVNARRTAEPATAEALDGQRLSLEWGRQNLALIASMVLALVTTYGGYDRAGVLRVIQEHGDERIRSGASVYGYSVAQVANMQRILAAERIAA